MNYNLGLQNRENKTAKAIELDKIFSLKDMKKLQNIDDFTTQFKNEMELKKYLLNKELISEEEANQSVIIFYKYRGEQKELAVAYENFKKFLDPFYVLYSVKSMASSISFLTTLVKHYDYKNVVNPQYSNICDIKLAIEDLKLGFPASNQLHIALNDLCMKAMHTKDKKSNRAKTNYRGLRDLGYLVYKVQNPQDFIVQQRKADRNIEQISLFESVDNQKLYSNKK